MYHTQKGLMMRKPLLFTAFILLLFASVFTVVALGPAPSWELTTAPAGVCSDDDVFVPAVEINVPAPQFASERGTYSAPGFPDLGYTLDLSFQGVGTFGFTVFTDPYVLPANTLVTLTVTTYNGPNYTGGTAYISSMTWDCTTGAIIALTNTVPVGDCPNPLISGSVVGEAPGGAQVYWAPNANSASPGIILNPGTYWVMGADETGAYSKVWLTCQSVFWVRSDTLQPSFRPPQTGEPLPTRVVS
jgi:hypothetical protein